MPAPGSRLRYRFDNALSRGPSVVIAYLALLTLLFVLAAGAVVSLTGTAFAEGDGYGEAAYQTLLRMLDPGTFSSDETWQLRVLSLGVTIAGIVLGGALIGLIANSVDQRVDRLQRGRGRVVERGHTLILGWSAQVPQIISELVIANETGPRRSVVVLASEDKTEIDERIRRQVPDLRGTRVVVRAGDPAVPSELERVCSTAARSIVVVRGDQGDAGVIKAVLAVRALDPTHSRCHVVAEMQDPYDAQTLRSVSQGRVITVLSDSVVAEVTAQACSRSGLGAVFTDLLDFDGNEIYFRSVPELIGSSYAQARLSLDDAALVGLLTSTGAVALNPPGDVIIADGDRLLVVAESDTAGVFSGRLVPAPAASRPLASDEIGPTRVLVVGWSGFGGRVLAELDELLVPGSTVHVQVDPDLVDPAGVLQVALRNATLTASSGRGGPEDLMSLQGLEVDQIIVLAYRDALPIDDADARTLLSLLTLRLRWPLGASPHVRVVAELLDQGNAVIAAPVGADDLIISNALASLMMAQLSERPQLATLFEELFRPDGAVVLLLPADRLLPPGRHTFADLVAAAGATGASAFGYREASSGKVVLNPPKLGEVTLHPGDTVIAVGVRAVPSQAAVRGAE